MTESTVVRTPRGHFRKLGDATVFDFISDSPNPQDLGILKFVKSLPSLKITTVLFQKYSRPIEFLGPLCCAASYFLTGL